MWWYWIVDAAIWIAGFLLIWKAFTSWKGYNRLKFSDQARKNLVTETTRIKKTNLSYGTQNRAELRLKSAW